MSKTERYTLPEDVERFRRMADVRPFDLDAAACIEAHHAPKWIGAPTMTNAEIAKAAGCVGLDGLVWPWFGSVWCNPPFDDLGAWVARAWTEAWSPRVESIVMLVPANRTEQPWWQQHVEPHRDRRASPRTPSLTSRFIGRRVNFGGPGSPTKVLKRGAKFGCALLIWRRR